MRAYFSQNPKRIEDIRADSAAIANNPQQDMFGAHVATALALRLVQSERENLTNTRHVVDFFLNRLISTPNFLLDSSTNRIKCDAQFFQCQGCKTLLFAPQDIEPSSTLLSCGKRSVAFSN